MEGKALLIGEDRTKSPPQIDGTAACQAAWLELMAHSSLKVSRSFGSHPRGAYAPLNKLKLSMLQDVDSAEALVSFRCQD